MTNGHHCLNLSSVFDVLASIKIGLLNVTAPFITIMTIGNVIDYVLYQKKIDMGVKIFEYFRNIFVMK